MIGIHVLKLEELLDILLGIAQLYIAKTCLFQVAKGWDRGTKNIGRSNDRWDCIGDWSNGFCNGASSEWISRIASDPNRATFWAYWVIFLEVINQPLLFPPFRAVLSLSTLVGLGYELLDADDRDGFER